MINNHNPGLPGRLKAKEKPSGESIQGGKKPWKLYNPDGRTILIFTMVALYSRFHLRFDVLKLAFRFFPRSDMGEFGKLVVADIGPFRQPVSFAVRLVDVTAHVLADTGDFEILVFSQSALTAAAVL
jgi:hypothetical protein